MGVADDDTRNRPARLAIGVIRPGRVGSAVGAALERAGHTVVAATAVSEESKWRGAERLPSARVMEPAALVDAADLVLLTVPDDALAPLVRGPVETGVQGEGMLQGKTKRS